MAYNRENVGVKMVERKMKWSGIYIAEEGGFFFLAGKEMRNYRLRDELCETDSCGGAE